MSKPSIPSTGNFKTHFKESFDLFFDGLHRYAFSILKDNEKAGDAVQSVFAKWWEHQTQPGGSDKTKAYLFAAVYRTCLNELRNERRRLSNYQNYLHEKETSSKESNESMEFEELNDHIQSSINDLSPQCKIIFCKSRFEEKKYIEIAEEMNLSAKTIEVQMGKALKFLRERLRIYLLSPN